MTGRGFLGLDEKKRFMLALITPAVAAPMVEPGKKPMRGRAPSFSRTFNKNSPGALFPSYDSGITIALPEKPL